MEERGKAIRGWPGGIVFTCVIAPADLGTEPVKQICAGATASTSALAIKANIKVAQVFDQRSFATMVLRDRALGLTVQVSPSDFNAPLAALVVRVFASRPYSDLTRRVNRAGPRKHAQPAEQPAYTTPVDDPSLPAGLATAGRLECADMFLSVV